MSLSGRLVDACERGDYAAVQRLVAEGACVDTEGMNENGVFWRPLHAAVAGRKEDVGALLLSHGADPNACVLLYGADSSPSIFQMLLDVGGDVNYACSEEPTLRWVVTSSSPGVVERLDILLQHPSLDITETNRHGLTAQQWAGAMNRSLLADRIDAEEDRRALLTPAEHAAWTAAYDYACVRRLDAAGLGHRVDVPAVRAVLASLRFAWIAGIVGK